MAEFLLEKIEVEKDPGLPRPARFTWRGQVRHVAEVVDEWVDVGFGTAPSRSRKWYNRRHRRYFVVRDDIGDVFEMYMDYSTHPHTWWLVRMGE